LTQDDIQGIRVLLLKMWMNKCLWNSYKITKV